ncbi:MAG: vWA domain-containing protein [Verrucomicrobiaceae bacterium]
MKRRHVISVLAAALTTPVFAHQVPTDAPTKVQLAILLDTSGSMSGLIEQTKTQLWKVVNTFMDAKQDGRAPFVEVALYEYGNSRLDHKADWIRQIQPFTRDLDQVSEDLFGLSTAGGDEFCGAVITRAIADLKWDASPKVYKAIFIAGNESFSQGPINPRSACAEAVKKGVVVNTIHCGREDVGLQGNWNTGLLVAGGSYLVIDHNAAVVHVNAPQDAKIVQLNDDLNKTYIPFGKIGQTKKIQQGVQDENSFQKKESGALVQRAVAKATQNYWNGNWDLCDASATASFDWTTLKKEELPKEMQKLDLEDRKKYVAEKRKARVAIQTRIRQLNKERAAYVAAKRVEQSGNATLDVAVTKTVREQAAKQGFQFEKK